MERKLQAHTPAGAELVADAERLAIVFAERAVEHDREGTFPYENSRDLAEAGFYGAPVPVELGGRGVESTHDILVACSRLASGDSSTTIGLNMHLNATLKIVRRYRAAQEAGNIGAVQRAAFRLREIAAGRMIISSCATEPGTDLFEPNTRATLVEGCWEINGTKIFCTGSPVATHLAITAAYEDEQGCERIGFAVIPANMPGVQMNNDWDALGMRASGSQSISLKGVRIPRQALNGAHSIGAWTDSLMEAYLPAGMFHASPSLGIAETAAATAVKMAGTMKKGRAGRLVAERSAIQHLAGENAIDLAAMRAVFDRTAAMLDDYYAAADSGSLRDTFQEVQAAKAYLNQASVRIVDRALTMSGGAGFMNKHPLARLYRDARAGGFMHPVASNMSTEFIGRLALGLEPDAA
jgi:alkylation response protein AidB-like acyl-CoA dehydrogenase